MFYIVNLNNKIMSICDYEPDKADLESRKEIAIFSKESVALNEAEYRAGKIVKHAKTTAELAVEKETSDAAAEEALIHDRIHTILRTQAITELKAEGKIK